MRNKKIKNASEIVYDNIKFKSKLEVAFYKILKERGFSPRYEDKTFVLWKGIKPTIPFYTRCKKDKTLKLDIGKIRDITYTPDFTFKYNGRLIIIEAKGIENDTFPIKKKLFRKLLEQSEDRPIYFELFTQKQLLQAIEILKSYELVDKENTIND